MHRMTLGVEQTFWDGNASISARLPIQYREFGNGQTIDGIADLTIVTKFIIAQNKNTGSVFSGGVAVTAPISRDAQLAEGGDLANWIIQPWLGFVYNADRFYVQGFTSYAAPLETRDVSLLANDIGIGYKVYQNRCSDSTLTAIVPTIEAHLLTPIRNRNLKNVTQTGSQQVGAPDMLTLTGGVHFGLWNRAWLTLGFGAPVTGLKLFDYEGVLQLNYVY
jgi:hypothetical protein